MPNKTYKIGGGIEIRMFFPDHNPPHIHVRADGMTAQISIQYGNVLAGRIKTGSLNRVKKWLKGERTALLTQWDELNR